MRGLDAAGLPHLDLWVARVLQERRKPSDFQLGPAVDQDIGIAQLDDEARTRINEVRVLGWFRQDADLDFVSPDLPGNRTEIGKSGDDFEFGVG